MTEITRIAIMVIFVFETISVIRDSADGTVVLPPADSVVLSGQQAKFHCRTDLPSPVTWYFNSIIPGTSEDIYSVNTFTNEMQSRYWMNITNDGRQYTLAINEADEMHAGVYKCKDDNGFGKPVSAELIVLVYEPDCYSDRTMRLVKCNVSSAGDIIPKMRCNSTYYQAINDSVLMRFAINETTGIQFCELCFMSKHGKCIERKIKIAVGMESEFDEFISDGNPPKQNDNSVAIIVAVVVAPAIIIAVIILLIRLFIVKRNKNNYESAPNKAI